MSDSLGVFGAGIAAGVFVGAVGAEIIRRTQPDGAKRLCRKVCETASAAKGAFVTAYRNAAGPRQAVEQGEPSPA